jgi:hypothetical protein
MTHDAMKTCLKTIKVALNIGNAVKHTTAGNKPPGTPQIEKNARLSGGWPTTVVRPNQLAESCTVLRCQEV